MLLKELLFYLRFYWKSLLWAIFIFIGSAISGDDLDKVQFIQIPHFDKIVHFVLYFTFFILLAGAKLNIQSAKKRYKSLFIKEGFIALFYSVAMEILQRFVFEARSFELFDLFANFLGIVFAVGFVLLFNNLFKHLLKFL